jgi:hypothetical protein
MTTRQPSTVTDEYWLYAKAPGASAVEVTRRSGKWLVFVPLARLDAVWAAIRRATRAGRLGYEAKTGTARPNPNAKQPGERVICVYTYDAADLDDVRRVRDELRRLGVTWKIPYKTDAATDAGRYAVRGDARISSYYE